LSKVAAAQELDLASVRRDGKLRGPVTMWAVRHGDGIYVRSVSGRGSSWFRGAADSHQAHVRAGGIERDVSLVEIDELNDEIDAAYSRDFKILGVCVSSLAFSFQRGTSLSVAARASLPTITGPATSGPAEPPPPRLRGTRGRHPTSDAGSKVPALPQPPQEGLRVPE
jgi:hypothetical protein